MALHTLILLRTLIVANSAGSLTSIISLARWSFRHELDIIVLNDVREHQFHLVGSEKASRAHVSTVAEAEKSVIAVNGGLWL